MLEFQLDFLPKAPENVQVTRDGTINVDDLVTPPPETVSDDQFEPSPPAGPAAESPLDE